MEIKIQKLNEEAIIPSYQTNGSAGFDFHALEDITLEPNETKLIKTGLAFEIPMGSELQVRPRSGLSLKTPLRITNSPGTVDSDYRGEVCIIMQNTGNINVNIEKGSRIAQGILCPVYQATFIESNDLSETRRGSEGFGSSGD